MKNGANNGPPIEFRPEGRRAFLRQLIRVTGMTLLIGLAFLLPGADAQDPGCKAQDCKCKLTHKVLEVVCRKNGNTIKYFEFSWEHTGRCRSCNDQNAQKVEVVVEQGGKTVFSDSPALASSPVTYDLETRWREKGKPGKTKSVRIRVACAGDCGNNSGWQEITDADCTAHVK